MGRYVQGRRKAGAVAVVAGLTALCLAAWMGWDIHYDIDAAGQASGPYEPWQVIGCVLCLLVVASSAGRWLPAVEIAATMTAAFTLAFSTSAVLLAEHDPLVVIGITLVFVATLAGSAVVASAAEVFWNLHHGRRSAADTS